MKSPVLWVLLISITILSVVSLAEPQHVVSGSPPVTITQGGNQATVSVGGALKTDSSATTQPVSGTVSAAQSGTWTVQPGNTANTTAWKVDGSSVTQPVSGPLTDAQLRASAVPVSGSFSSTPLTGCGNTNYDSGIITLPNTTTVLTATTTCISSVTLINLTNTQQTCTVTDGQGSPANLIPPSFDLQAKSDAVFVRNGVKALSGVKWSCTNTSAVAGIVRGNQ